MTLVVDRFKTLIPSKSKPSPSGWLSFNAPCCHHRGHSTDKRKRGGIRFDDGIVYNCFNCKYTASWKPGRTLSGKFKSLCKWLGASDDDINTMVFEALKTESTDSVITYEEVPTFEETALPEGSLPLSEWLDIDFGDDAELEAKFAEVVAYVYERGFNPLSNSFYWSPDPGFSSRLILPFTYKGKNVGYTARKVGKGNPKYLSDHNNNYVYNIDAQEDDQKYLFVTEGPFDALAVNGVALLGNQLNDQQFRLINQLGYEVIVIPDQDKPGIQLINKAQEYGWNVAFPNWESDIKDVNDAVNRYGRVFVTVDAIKTAVNGSIRITMKKKEFEQKVAEYD
jgi:hypothetical protein